MAASARDARGTALDAFWTRTPDEIRVVLACGSEGLSAAEADRRFQGRPLETTAA